MKYIITKIVLVWAALAALVGFSKKKENESLNDAIKFPDMGKTAVVEDFEMAAYHNQA
jgi:CRISPR/Cas system-associated endonuclease Cas3-HD